MQLTGVYKNRMDNALRVAEKIQSYLKDGYMVRDEQGQRIIAVHIDTNTDHGDECQEITAEYEDAPNTRLLLMIGNPDWDNGLHETIETYNEYFKDWTMVHPNDIKKLEL